MPLVVDGRGKAVAHGELRAIGFWMIVKGSIPIQPVRVFVSYEALAQLDPFDIRDFAATFEHFVLMQRSMKVCNDPADCQ